MNVAVEILGPCKRLLRVEVDAEKVDGQFAKITNGFRKYVRLPGFRSGKAPMHILKKRYENDIKKESQKQLISESYRQALKQEDLHPVGYPDIETVQFGVGQSLIYTVTVEIAPAFELPRYKGIPVKREISVVTEADMDRALDVLRTQRATYKDLDRPTQDGDYVEVNYSATIDGRPLIEVAPSAHGLSERKNFWIEINNDSFLPGFGEQLIGASANDKRSVKVEFPFDFVNPELRARSAQYEVEVVKVRERALPDLNDEFAVALGAKGMDELREGVRRDLGSELLFKQQRSVRNQIIEFLRAQVEFDLPETMVSDETRNVVYNIVKENQDRGISKQIINEQKDEIFNAASADAKGRLKTSFILARIAQQENIKAETVEIEQRILQMAEQYEIAPEKLVKQIKERNGLSEVEEQVVTSKVLKRLEDAAQIEDVIVAPESDQDPTPMPPAPEQDLSLEPPVSEQDSSPTAPETEQNPSPKASETEQDSSPKAS